MEKFQRLHKEQHRLTTDGTFLKGLKDAAALMTNLSSVGLSDDPGDDYTYASEDLLVNANIEMFRWLTLPLRWAHIDQAGNKSFRIAARTPSVQQLLESYSKAAISNKGLHPMKAQEGWKKLGTACQKLESLRVRRDVPYKQIPGREIQAARNLKQLSNYIGALGSKCGGNTLESLELDFTCRPHCKQHDIFAQHDNPNGGINRFPASAMAQKFKNLSHLRSLTLRALSLTPEALRAVFSGLGTRLVNFEMSAIKLVSSSWSPLVPLLANKLANENYSDVTRFPLTASNTVYSATRRNNHHAKDPPQPTSIVGRPKEGYAT
ncbi:hypothetical protein QBC38DRAFT_531198 [Podospora fimiseda]|uniref:Uncharacterized protein n=1 Tax=Podospora fimiseda TaxID=252190 RepID=A0AAN7BKY8_9PEZI|nr:hypothetical protein QBC38DRAFT_531198 [Podospora fimiseda]